MALSQLLKALSENCKDKFKDQLCAKTFVEDLDTLAKAKARDDKVYSKLAQCLENWVELFGTEPSFVAVRRVYEHVLMQQQPHQQHQQQQRRRSVRDSQAHREPNAHYVSADPKTDIELAKNNAQLFSQTLSFTDPTQEDITQNSLMQEFYTKCQSLQKVVSEHLQTCEDPDIISELLEANNELVSCFKTYQDMLERHAVNEATFNSRHLNHRDTQQDEIPSTDVHAESSSPVNHNSSAKEETRPAPETGRLLDHSPTHPHGNDYLTHHQNENSADPFNPFADTNAILTASGGTSGNVNLPPPLTPYKLHNEHA
ncbi:hypothetical protein BDF14DRAFT_1839146 [Spinellus fusiger]|nr:hypothetical protein BDF14DRAFT_1839146 [Spinellus fusiger]